MQFKEGYKQTEIGLIPVDWEVVDFVNVTDKGDRYSFTGGPFGSDLKGEHYKESGVRVIQLQNIGDGKFINNDFVFTSDEKAQELNNSLIYPNEIIISKMAEPLARACLIPSFEDKYLMCSDGIRINVDKNSFSNYFVFSYINSPYFRKEAEKRGTGSTRLRIGLGDLKTIPFPKLMLQEQQKIAEILSTVDAKLDAIDAEIEQTRTLKKGLMQTLLTQGIGHTQFKDSPLGQVPESWEVKYLKQVVVDSNGLRRGPFGGALKKEIFVEQGFQVYEQRNAIYDDFITSRYFIDEVKFNSMKDFQIESGDFIVSCSGTIGKIAEVPSWFKKGVINQALLKIKLDNNVVVNKYFLQYFRWEKFQNKIVENTQGGAMKNLVGMTVFKNTFVPVPSIEEQTKIANILSTVDDKIGLLQQRKSETETLKKGLIQKLLTGEVRVKVA